MVFAGTWGQRTVSGAGRHAAGAVDGPLPRAVAAAVSGRWVIAVTIGKLHSSPTGAGTLAPGPPGPPVAMAWGLKWKTEYILTQMGGKHTRCIPGNHVHSVTMETSSQSQVFGEFSPVIGIVCSGITRCFWFSTTHLFCCPSPLL